MPAISHIFKVSSTYSFCCLGQGCPETTNAGYWNYPTQSNTPPSRDVNDVSGNNANYYIQDSFLLGHPYFRTEAGEFQNSDSAYGTFDQAGNLWEWNKGSANNGFMDVRSTRGGSFAHYIDFGFPSSSRTWGYEPDEVFQLGFRVVASQPVPKPPSSLALTGGLGCLLPLVRRRK
jgi:formylglycine-generating enzyme required for sulfatase activity